MLTGTPLRRNDRTSGQSVFLFSKGISRVKNSTFFGFNRLATNTFFGFVPGRLAERGFSCRCVVIIAVELVDDGFKSWGHFGGCFVS